MIWHMIGGEPVEKRIGDATNGFPVIRMEFDAIDVKDIEELARNQPERLAFYMRALSCRFVNQHPKRRNKK